MGLRLRRTGRTSHSSYCCKWGDRAVKAALDLIGCVRSSVLASDSPLCRSSPLTRDDASPFAAPGAFGPFRVMHQIGVGVLGPVFRTYDPSEDRLVSVKAFHLDITPEQARTLIEALERLITTELAHPGVVAPLAVGFEDDVPYLAQEYVAAESLDVAIRHYSPASIETAMPFIRQMADAVDAAHERGVVHGALHLRDIFVTPDEARVTGFGIVTALEEIGLAGPIRRPYTAPEVIAGAGGAPLPTGLHSLRSRMSSSPADAPRARATR